MARRGLIINRLSTRRCLPIEAALDVFVIRRLVLALAARAATRVVNVSLVAEHLVRGLARFHLRLTDFLGGALVLGDAAVGNSALETMFRFGDL